MRVAALITRATAWLPHTAQRDLRQRLLRDHTGYINTEDEADLRALAREIRLVRKLRHSVHQPRLAGTTLPATDRVPAKKLTPEDRSAIVRAISFQVVGIVFSVIYVFVGKPATAPLDPSPVLLMQSAVYTAGAYLTGRCHSVDGRIWNALWAWFGVCTFVIGYILWRIGG
jgi:hypothetical protein